MALIALAIASVLGDNSIFKSWISGGSWGCIIVAALAVVFREWETEDESYVILEIGDDDDSDDFNTDGDCESKQYKYTHVHKVICHQSVILSSLAVQLSRKEPQINIMKRRVCSRGSLDLSF